MSDKKTEVLFAKALKAKVVKQPSALPRSYQFGQPKKPLKNGAMIDVYMDIDNRWAVLVYGHMIGGSIETVKGHPTAVFDRIDEALAFANAVKNADHQAILEMRRNPKILHQMTADARRGRSVLGVSKSSLSPFSKEDEELMQKGAEARVRAKARLEANRKAPLLPSLAGYSGHIRPYDLFELQQRLAEFCWKNSTTLKQLQTKYLSSGFSPTRFRFDLYNAAIVPLYDTAKGKDELSHRFASYADDSDIDKAMAFIIARS